MYHPIDVLPLQAKKRWEVRYLTHRCLVAASAGDPALVQGSRGYDVVTIILSKYLRTISSQASGGANALEVNTRVAGLEMSVAHPSMRSTRKRLGSIRRNRHGCGVVSEKKKVKHRVSRSRKSLSFETPGPSRSSYCLSLAVLCFNESNELSSA